jgi:hypothetical protein
MSYLIKIDWDIDKMYTFYLYIPINSYSCEVFNFIRIKIEFSYYTPSSNIYY